MLYGVRREIASLLKGAYLVFVGMSTTVYAEPWNVVLMKEVCFVFILSEGISVCFKKHGNKLPDFRLYLLVFGQEVPPEVFKSMADVHASRAADLLSLSPSRHQGP